MNYKNIVYNVFIGIIIIMIVMMIIGIFVENKNEGFATSGDKNIDDKVKYVINNEALGRVLGKETLEQLANEAFGDDNGNPPESFTNDDDDDDDDYNITDGKPNSKEKVKKILNKVIGPYDTLYEKKSNYQDIGVIKFKKNKLGYDTCLMLNNEPQLCNNDEKDYHELIVHFPAAYLKSLKKVLIIGGGDCMTLREVMKYNVEKVVMLELDQEVINTSKKFFNQNDYKNDPRVKIIIGDASKNIKKLPDDVFDMVIIDTTEDSATNSPIDTTSFIEQCKNKLLNTGLLIKNGENQSNILAVARIFKNMDMYVINRMTFLGDYKFIIASQTLDVRNSPIVNNETRKLCENKKVSFYDINTQKKHFIEWN